MTYLVIDRALRASPDHWDRVEIRRLVILRREANSNSAARLLSLSASDGVQPRPDDGGRQLPSADTVTTYWIVRPDDLVFNPMWAIEGGVAVSRIEGAVSPAYRVYKLAQRLVPRFLHYFLRSRPALDQYRAMVRGVTTFDRSVTREDFEAMPIALPSLREQRAIADFLDAEIARIDALIAKKRRLATKLQERRAAIMSSGVAGELLRGRKMVDSSLSWIEHRPEHWDEPLLKLVAQLGSGHTPSRNRPEWWVDCTIPWITTGEVSQMREDRIEYVTETREKISELGMANSSAELHPAGTVVLSRTASAGFSAIMGEDMATSQDFVTWTCGPLLDPRYLLLCLRAMRHDLLGRLAQGSTHQTIYMPDIESIRIPLPPLGEQQAIVDAVWRSLHNIDNIIDLLKRQTGLLIEHRQALITGAVTGRIEVPGALIP